MNGLIHASDEISGLELDDGNQEFLGKGYSGTAYKVPVKGTDQAVVKKVFHSEGLPKLVNTLIFGNPLDLIATEKAVRTAHFRRRVFSPLVEWWSDGAIGVANSLGYGFDSDEKAYYLLTEFVDGSGPTIATPFKTEEPIDLDELIDEVMEPLRDKLLAVNASDWQVNYRNSRSITNFLKGRKSDDIERWCLVDFESGVPALAVMPVPKLSYIKDFWRYLRNFPTFDDVDIDALRSHVDNHRVELAGFIGAERFSQLELDIAELETAQSQWKSMPRSDKYISYLEKKEFVTPEKAEVLRRSKARLYWYMTSQGVKSAGNYLTRSLPSLLKRPLRFAGKSLRTMVSPSYGQRWGREYIEDGLEDWVDCGLFSEEQAQIIRDPVENGSFRTRFGALAWQIGPVWGISKLIEIPMAPLLLANEMYWQAAVVTPIIAFYGISPVLRAIHTMSYSAIAGSIPKTALATSLIPVAGNFAFVFQMARDTRGQGMEELSDFLLYDSFRRLADSRLTFLWGGKGTLVDHKLNKLAQKLTAKK